MSDELKLLLADELGVGDVVRTEGGFGSVSAKNCGKLVKLALERVEATMAQRAAFPAGLAPSPATPAPPPERNR
jgi:small acid-soluble spore protein F (minor alpha/beta-type SASP)